MRRREFIALVGASVARPFAATAQQAGRIYRVGGLSSGPGNLPQLVAMFDELRRFGFIEGQNLTIDWRSYALHIDLIPEFVAELVKSKVDVIYASGAAGIRAAQQATATVPILGITQDMVGQGLVNSLARPGGNTTGVSVLATELDGHRVASTEEITATLDTAKASGVAALNVLSSPLLYGNRQLIR
jgi:putative ABC transport system substrate-binding protein